ncbi:hypothetical protein [Flavobacterium sp. MDT1-60]|uniref:hypothetical protein n=1 Tax=Flavobacterium sp. MDT1-60 TaxID=1979344 RepID=UPI0017800232|nr:hypothetical protein [Flavobacterium sp. MDT1-60]QOG01920.1 hypothetical protein IHE43_19275 [Flavobacterium sp. MDT1-60]
MKKLFIILASTTFFACDSKDDNNVSSFYLNTSIDFSVFNADGEDLLDPETPNHLEESKIKLFYVVNGVTKEFFEGHLDHPRNIMIYKSEKEYIIGVGLNHYENGKSTTYIQWNEKDTDTIEATFVRGKNFIYPKDVWLNGKLVSEGTKRAESPYVRLTK